MFTPCRTCWIIKQHLNEWNIDSAYWIIHQLLLERKWKLESDMEKLDWLNKTPAERRVEELERELLLEKQIRATKMARCY